MKKAQRHLTTARRELRRAVERFAEIDPLEGHRIEAVRQARAVKAEADRMVEQLGGER